jgi:RimJ/RimL family protein N-acetyltransferase
MAKPVQQIEIESIRLHHAEGLRRVFDTVAREGRYLAAVEAPPIDDVRRYILEALENSNPMFVALADEAVVGWCDIRRDSIATRAHRGTLGIGVAPPWRGFGIGSRLMSAVLERARPAGFVRVELDVHADNLRAITLYEKFGFIVEGRQRYAWRIEGHFRDAILMALIDRGSGAHGWARLSGEPSI